jgi:hypothetical protein
MPEDIKKPSPYITSEEALMLFQSILQNYSGVFRVQSGLLQTIKLRLVNLSADPVAGEVGDLVCVGGKLKICTATTPTWTVVGTQT